MINLKSIYDQRLPLESILVKLGSLNLKKKFIVQKSHFKHCHQNIEVVILGLEKEKLVTPQNGHISLDLPKIKKISALHDLQLSNFEKIKCLYFLD